MQAEQAKPKPLARSKLTAHGPRKFMGEQKSYQIGDVLNFSDTNQDQWENSSFESKQSYHQRSSTNPREQYYMKENEYSELTELRMRTAQMEKTLRWWSECTSNWREKWSKVKIERNKAREEVKRIKVAYENAEKELNVLRQQKVLLINENTNLKQEVSDRSSQSNSDESVVKSFT
uniref:Coiled-coil domain-containing protein 102A n=1 Tax=Ciona savignyi TaxID=51511 RepID=H2ZMG3_CIOSA